MADSEKLDFNLFQNHFKKKKRKISPSNSLPAEDDTAILQYKRNVGLSLNDD